MPQEWPLLRALGCCHKAKRLSSVNEQIAWVLKGEIDFRLGSKQRLCGQDDVIVIPGGTEHEGSFREDSEVIDFFAPSRDNFLLGGKPAYMSEG